MEHILQGLPGTPGSDGLTGSLGPKVTHMMTRGESKIDITHFFKLDSVVQNIISLSDC